jgi:type I restriction enzyme S subunit
MAGVETLFLLYLLRANEARLAGKGPGSTFSAISGDDLRSLDVLAPPLPEQRRIVAKIEELFSQLDVGVEELKKAEAQLKRYRQSVLKAAFSGELTSEWRRKRLANSQQPLESAADLLERIKEERKRLATSHGKKYKEPPPLDTSDLPELPEGWAWARLGAVSRVRGGYAFKSSDYRDTGVLLVRQTNLGGDRVDPTGAVYLPASYMDTYAEFAVRKGDILIGMSGSIGKRCAYEREEPALQNQRTGLVLPHEPNMRGYVWHFLATMEAALTGLGKGVGVQNVSGGQIESCPIAIAPLPEQKVIAGEIDRVLSIADAEERAIEAALAQAARLRQSILKRAFEGRLVPQDPSDEPASRLLNRIREARAKEPTANRQRAKRRKGGAQ